MKTKLLLFLFAFTCTLQAQLPKLKTADMSEMRLIADTITSTAKRTYKYNGEKYDADKRMHAYYYVNQEDSTMKISVYFRTVIIGSNAALEIKGTTEYRFYTAIGKYLDLFPFWIKYIDANADITACSKTNSYKKIDNKMFYLREYENTLWMISMN